MRPIKATLIDPYTMTVTEVEHDASDGHEIYTLLSGAPHDVRAFECVHLDHGDAIFIDEYGKITGHPVEFFMWDGYPEPIAGRGLILGSNRRGDTVQARTTLAEARAKVSFGQLVRVSGGLIWITNATTDNHPEVNAALAPSA